MCTISGYSLRTMDKRIVSEYWSKLDCQNGSILIEVTLSVGLKDIKE